MDRAKPARVTLDRHVVRGVGKHIAARSSPISRVKALGSRALPLNTRCRPRTHSSPRVLTGGAAEIASRMSAGSASSSAGVSSSEAIRRSISPISKPVTSMSKSRPLSDKSRSCSASRRSSQVAFSVSLLSAILKARAWAGVKWSRRKVGTSSMPSSPQASNRPCPAITLSSASTSTGTLKPKVLMLLAICLICFLLCWRGFAGSGLSSARGRKMISKLRWLVSNPLDLSSLFSCITISLEWGLARRRRDAVPALYAIL